MNYWHILDDARKALAEGRFREAEHTFEEAALARRSDAKRVFLSETLPNGIKRLWRQLKHRDRDTRFDKVADLNAGRWEGAVTQFREAFRSRSETLLMKAERQLETGVTVDPTAAADMLAAAMYLSVRSRFVVRRLPPARILTELFELLSQSGRLCDHDLAGPELELSASTRLRLAELALPDLVQLPRQERVLWVHAILAQLDDLAAEWQPGSWPQRHWLAALLADRYGESADDLLERWQACDEPEQPESNRRWSRLRRLEILAGRDRRRLAVPCYGEAHRLAALLSPSVDDEEERRCCEAMSVLDYRRPGLTPSRGWVSAMVTNDGSVLAVYWWADEPRDIARWHPGEGPEAIKEFLGAAEGRVLWEGEGPSFEILAVWPEAFCGRPLQPYLETVLEPMVPLDGWSHIFSRRLALAHCGPWRAGWRADLGHPLLAPPGQDGLLSPAQEDAEPVLHAGLLWLAVLHRINTADPALRAGLGELARRGDPAAAFLHGHAVLGDPAQAAVDAGFEAWTLPLLWTRPDPLANMLCGEDSAEAEQQDLAGHDVAVVVTSRPARVLSVWGRSVRRWRAVIDRLDRLGEFGHLARASYGPVTVVPFEALVHDLQAALDRLQEMAAAAPTAPPADQMLAICHWIRIVETHNGDLLDTSVLRPRQPGTCPWLDRYVASVADLPRQKLQASEAMNGGSWATQYVQRARRSGVVIGLVGDLPGQSDELDATWGVYDGSDASWVFWDSAAVHWCLYERGPDFLHPYHELLASRGRRHLSLLSGLGLYPENLATWFDLMLAPYGQPYHRDLQDTRPPRLRLAGHGPLPCSFMEPGAFGAAALRHLHEADGRTFVQLPGQSIHAAFWKAAAAGAFGPVTWSLTAHHAGIPVEHLVVPQWAALDTIDVHVLPEKDTMSSWCRSDTLRQERLAKLKCLLALECGALLARATHQVEILDGRWWRLFEALDQLPGPEITGAGFIELLDLSELKQGADLGRLADAITAWLVERGQVAGQLPGWAGLPLPDGQSLAQAGVYHHIAPASSCWRDLAADLLRRWEQGGLVGRLLVVSEEPPPGAAALSSLCAGPGATVLKGNPSDHPWGAVVWTRSGALATFLSRGCYLPVFERVVLFDAANLCPPSAHAIEGARLLAWLTGGAAVRLDLVGDPCREPWSRFFGAALGMACSKDAEPGRWHTIRRGEVAQVERLCPQCGKVAQGVPDALICCHCSYDLVGYCPRPVVADAMVGRVRNLIRQTDLGREEPLELWTEASVWRQVQDVLSQQGAVLDPDEECAWNLPDGRRWRRRDLSEQVAAAVGPAVLLQPPSDQTRIRPWAARGNRSALTLLYDRLEILHSRHSSELRQTKRFLNLLCQQSLLATLSGQTELPTSLSHLQTFPLWHLAWLTGSTVQAVRRDLELLCWAATLTAGPAYACPDRRAAGKKRSTAAQWLVKVSLRDAEQQLFSLAARCESLLDDWLADGQAGSWLLVQAPGAPMALGSSRVSNSSWLQTQAGIQPGIRSDAQLDNFLALLAAMPLDLGQRLVYTAPEGAWFSSRRVVGWLGDRDRLGASLRQRIEDLASHMRTSLAGASLVDNGFLIDVNTKQAASSDVLGLLPQALGFWSRHGPANRDDIAIAELERLRRLPALTDDGISSELLRELAEARDQWIAALECTPAGARVLSPPSSKPERAGRLNAPRRLFGKFAGNAQRPLQQEVATWLLDPSPSRLVLAGPYGSGRSASFLAALAANESGRQATIWCPDVATAVRLHLAARNLDPGWQPVLQIHLEGQLLPAKGAKAPGEQDITVIAELQRWPRDASYELQERARGAHLLLCVDTADLQPGTTWEDHFLTTPSRLEVRRSRVQALQASQLWRVTAPYLPAGQGEHRARRRERGMVHSRLAGTLEECAGAVDAASAAERLGRVVTLVLPLQEDVSLMARAMSDRGWVAVREQDLQPLLLPGMMETLAALADVHQFQHGVWPGQVLKVSAAATTPILAGFLTAGQAKEYEGWLKSLPGDVLDVTSVFLSHLRRSPWGLLCCGHMGVWRNMMTLMNAASAPVDVLSAPLWEAWRRRVDIVLGRQTLVGDMPNIACLTSAVEAVGEPAESLVYICFGSEPAPVHRRVLLRATDRLLVLYQEHSPLPDHWEA